MIIVIYLYYVLFPSGCTVVVCLLLTYILLSYLVRLLCYFFFFFKQNTAYEWRISDWSSDVCASDRGLAERDAERAHDRVCRGDVEVQVRHHVLAHVLAARKLAVPARAEADALDLVELVVAGIDGGDELARLIDVRARLLHRLHLPRQVLHRLASAPLGKAARLVAGERNLGSQREHVRRKPLRSEEHTSELQSLMRISYAVFCFKKKKIIMYISHYHVSHHMIKSTTINRNAHHNVQNQKKLIM